MTIASNTKKESTAEEKEMAVLRERIRKAGGGRHAWVEKIAGSFSAPEDQAAYRKAMRLSRAIDKPTRRKAKAQRTNSKK